MSGRPRPSRISQRTQNINDDDAWEKRRIVLQNLHDAAQIGDVSTVEHIFETYTELHIDITRRGRNTTLHTAISHNQEGPIIDYLIENGADINIENSKGQCPLTMAIIYCKRGSKAFEKLIHAGAKTSFDSGAFSGMSLMDVAVQYKNEHVINFLSNQVMDEKYICKEVSPTATLTKKQQQSKYRATCPICNELVTYPTKMSRIEVDQMNIEQRIQNNGDYVNGGKAKTNRRKYITRKYMDKLLAHSNGQVYNKLCGIEYHGVENMRLRKEISESFGILHAVHECCVSLGINAPTTDDEDIKFDNIFLIDLCSGKGITTAICGAMNGNDNDANGKNNYFLAIDRMLDHTIPHFLNKDQVVSRESFVVSSCSARCTT